MRDTLGFLFQTLIKLTTVIVLLNTWAHGPAVRPPRASARFGRCFRSNGGHAPLGLAPGRLYSARRARRRTGAGVAVVRRQLSEPGGALTGRRDAEIGRAHV